MTYCKKEIFSIKNDGFISEVDISPKKLKTTLTPLSRATGVISITCFWFVFLLFLVSNREVGQL